MKKLRMDRRGCSVFGLSLVLMLGASAEAQMFHHVQLPDARAGVSSGCAAIDFDNDGDLDLYVSNSSGLNNLLYRNEGNGAFAIVTSSVRGTITNDGGDSEGAAWSDFDNDGFPDLFVANYNSQRDFLYRGIAGGTFLKITNSLAVTDRANGVGVAWADFDNDGNVDLFVGNGAGQRPFLYLNRGGDFVLITNTAITASAMNAWGCSWADYDGDGWQDLFVANFSGKNFLYHNERGAGFSSVTNTPLTALKADFNACAWGDYDNDGDPDLFVTVGGYGTAGRNLLFQNQANGTFLQITNSALVADTGNFTGASWGDYDNDGNLDLIVANLTGRAVLFHNLGGGQFAKVTNEIVTKVNGSWSGTLWADFDGNGFLDLFLANWSGTNTLFFNEGNSNHWIEINLVGSASNTSAIGAKVRVQAIMGREYIWQTREVSGGSGYTGQSPLLLHFGLADARMVERLRIEWPDGTVQELSSVAADHRLTVIEPPRFILTSRGEALLRTPPGRSGTIESSTNLVDWMTWTPGTNSIDRVSLRSSDSSRQFFRAKLIP
jgi:hypothetical protein